MKTFVFFCREELTNLYYLIDTFLSQECPTLFLCYGEKEQNALKSRGVNDDHIVVFKHALEEELKNKELNLKELQYIDSLFRLETNGRFTLNGSIQYDRGFSFLGNEEALLLAQSYYRFWDKFLRAYNVACVLHEMPSLLMNHMCAVVCKHLGIIYLHNIIISGEAKYSYLNIIGDDYSCPQLQKEYFVAQKDPSRIDVLRCKKFISNFRESYQILCSNISVQPSLRRWLFKAICERARTIILKSKYDRLIDNIDYWLIHNKEAEETFWNLVSYRRHLNFDNPVFGEKYYFYPFHLEPEATVLYSADGIYENQVKLIQNIAASLPVGYYLYVKDHPHYIGYRNLIDYLRLLNIPNVRLLHSSISGKSIIANSVGVITINGTAGLEGLLLGKHVYTFGNAYYNIAERVHYVRNIRDLSRLLQDTKDKVYVCDDDLYLFVHAYLKAQQFGMIDYFGGRSSKLDVDEDENARIISCNILNFISDMSMYVTD